MRLIDADALIDAMTAQAGCKTCNSYHGVRCRACTWDDAITLTDDLGDKHLTDKSGWTYGEDKYGQDGWRCNRCKYFVPWYYKYHKDSHFISDYRFCPSCGSRMLSYTGMDRDICKGHKNVPSKDEEVASLEAD